MTTLPYAPARVIRWTWLGLAAGALLWYADSWRPRAARLASRASELAAREARVRRARADLIVLGAGGLDSALVRFRADSALLSVEVPHDSAAGALASEVKALLGAQEPVGLRILRTEALPRGSERGFTVSGYAVTAAGRYAAVRTLLVALAGHPRLLRVRRLRLAAVPDSLVAAALPADAAAAEPDTVFPPGFPSPGVTEPFTAVATFEVLWYTRASAPAAPAAGIPRDSTALPTP